MRRCAESTSASMPNRYETEQNAGARHAVHNEDAASSNWSKAHRDASISTGTLVGRACKNRMLTCIRHGWCERYSRTLMLQPEVGAEVGAGRTEMCTPKCIDKRLPLSDGRRVHNEDAPSFNWSKAHQVSSLLSHTPHKVDTNTHRRIEEKESRA